MAAPMRGRRGDARPGFASSSRSRPLHQPHNIAGIEAAIKAFPSIRRRSPASTPPSTAAIPSSRTPSRCRARYYDEGVRRYGFHGLSYEYIARRLKQHRAADRARGRHRRPSRQRRLDVRDQERPLDGLDHGLHRARRPADGHALRPARPRRAALSDGREEDGRRSRSRICSTRNPASRACRESPRTCASSRPPTARRRATRSTISCTGSAASSLASPRPSKASRASSSPAASANIPGGFARPCSTGMEWMGIQIDEEANRASAPDHQREVFPGHGLRHSDGRRAHDRQPHRRTHEGRRGAKAVGSLTKANPMTSTYSPGTAPERATQDAGRGRSPVRADDVAS